MLTIIACCPNIEVVSCHMVENNLTDKHLVDRVRLNDWFMAVSIKNYVGQKSVDKMSVDQSVFDEKTWYHSDSLLFQVLKCVFFPEILKEEK